MLGSLFRIIFFFFIIYLIITIIKYAIKGMNTKPHEYKSRNSTSYKSNNKVIELNKDDYKVE